MPKLIDQTLGGYRIVEQIGLGGMATVFKAYQPAMGRYVALKIISTHLVQEPTFVQRFQQEAKVIARLEHVHILPVYDYGQEEAYFYLAMRLIETGTLKERLEQASLPLAEVRRVVAQVGSALAYAHQLGIVHRDFKPSNVLMDSQGDCYLADFGIAKMVGGGAGLTGSGIVGTPHYIAPEQGQSLKVDHRADIYAMGVVIYEMVAGQVPFEAENPFVLIMKHLSEAPPRPRSIKPDLPEGVEQVILKALAKEPAGRYQSMADLVTAFDRALRGAPVETPPVASSRAVSTPVLVEEGQPPPAVNTPTLAPAWRRRLGQRSPWWLVVASTALLALVLAGGIFSQMQGGKKTGGGQSPPNENAQATSVAATSVAASQTTATQTAATPYVEQIAQAEAFTPTPAAALSPTPIPPTSTPTPTPTPLPDAVVNAEVTNLWAGPGAGYDITSQLKEGEALQIAGRNPTGGWVEVITPDGTRGWVAIMWLQVNRPLDAVAVAAIPAAPTPEPTVTPTQTPLPPTSTPTPIPPPPISSALAPGGGRIAFRSNRDGNDEIYVMNADGSGQTNLTNHFAYDDYPSWLPDGRHIAFLSDRKYDFPRFGSYIMNTDGSGVSLLMSHSNHDEMESMTWSPDGKRIAFESSRDDSDSNCMAASGECNTEIYVMNAGGSGLIRLTDHPARDIDPTWSPDGRWIAFASNREAAFDIYMVSVDGGEITRLTANSDIFQTSPAWSPDGALIAVEANTGRDQGIFLIRTDGGAGARLTKNPDFDIDPAWSPDGKRIAFASKREGNFEIYAINVDGSGLTRLTNNPAMDMHPTWSP